MKPKSSIFSASETSFIQTITMSSTTKTNKRKHKQSNDGKHSLSDLKKLGQNLLSSRAHINNLPILLTFITPDSPSRFALESLLSLQSFFTPLIPQLPSSTPQKHVTADPELVYFTWLRSKFDEFVSRLVQLVVSSKTDDPLREVVLDGIMEFLKVGSDGKFNSAIYHKLLYAIVHSGSGVDDILFELIATKYFNYVDVRYFTYISLEKLARTLQVIEEYKSPDPEAKIQLKPSMEHPILKIHYLLSHIPLLEAADTKLDYEMWNGFGVFSESGNKKKHADLEGKHAVSRKADDKVLSTQNVAKKMKSKFTKAWMTFLRLPLPLHVYKEVLATLHHAVIPYLSNPVMLSDFLTISYDIGGVVSVMALSGLHILMTQHGLEYPNFYNKLYSLLEPSIFIAKHRAKFLQLLDSCLKSSLLPAYLTAAFCKKLSRLALFIPPSGSLVVFALVHNLLQRHSSIYCLVHRERDAGTINKDENKDLESAEDCNGNNNISSEKPGIDHFKNEETDPKNTNALRSSLWEVDTLRNHYCPPVSSFVVSIENDFSAKARAAEIAVKDFTSGSYGTIFSNEIKRRVKQVPLAFYKATPTSLFSESDFPGWTFDLREETSTIENDQDVKRQRTE